MIFIIYKFQIKHHHHLQINEEYKYFIKNKKYFKTILTYLKN